MPRRKVQEQPLAGQFELFKIAGEHSVPVYSEQPRLPECSIRTTFGELILGDMVDYWPPIPLKVTVFICLDGRTTIKARHGHHQQFASAPDNEIIWRMPRDGE